MELAVQSTARRAVGNHLTSADGWRCVPLGGDAQIRLRQSRSGRFTKIGLPFPQATANFVGVLEIVGGILLIGGFLTRPTAIPFVIEMLVAILSTKISLYLGTSPLPLPPVPPQIGFWAVLHEIRSEYAQLMTTMFLLIAGPGRWSLDALLIRQTKEGKQPLRNPDKVVYVGYSE